MDKTISNNKGAISSEDVLKIGLNLQKISFAVDGATFDSIKPYLDTIVEVVKNTPRRVDMRNYPYASPVIAERITQIIKENNLTDLEIARIIDVERKTIMKYRRGETNPSIRFIRWICSTYKVDANWLLDLEKGGAVNGQMG